MSQLNVSISGNIQCMYGKSGKCCQCKEATEIQNKIDSLVPANYTEL